MSVIESIEELPGFHPVDLLTALVMGEAEAEPMAGKIAVASVVRNRLEDPRWPNAWKKVMLQPYQFSCFLPDYFRPEIAVKDEGNRIWRECSLAAHGIFEGFLSDVTSGANHYYSVDIQAPYWAQGQTPVAEIGKHRFYKL